MIDFANYKLGKLPAKPASESKRVFLREFMAETLPAPRAAVDWTGGGHKRPMFGDDAVGDCTCAEVANTFVGMLEIVYGMHGA
jgi:hypothetical protein